MYTITYFNIRYIADDQLVLMYTGSPIQHILGVFWDKGGPLFRGGVRQVNLHQAVVGCPLVGTEHTHRPIVGDVL